jgi:ankyrin repeat protein
MEEDLFQIVRLGDKARFFSLIERAEIDQLNEFGQNLLHEAIAGKNTELGEELIRRGINVNQQDPRGQTPLHYSALHKNPALAKKIIENGGDLGLLDAHGNQPLWTAVFNAKEDYEIVSLFRRCGGNPRHTNKHGRSPLDFAKQIGNQTLIAILED